MDPRGLLKIIYGPPRGRGPQVENLESYKKIFHFDHTRIRLAPILQEDRLQLVTDHEGTYLAVYKVSHGSSRDMITYNHCG